jgi:hypothetical protein
LAISMLKQGGDYQNSSKWRSSDSLTCQGVQNKHHGLWWLNTWLHSLFPQWSVVGTRYHWMLDYTYCSHSAV